MGFFDYLRQPDINQGVTDCKETPGAILLDVRTPQEYGEGHIPGSRNIPLQGLDSVEAMIGEKETPLFVYCYSGARSRQAVGILKSMGYTRVTNIGGIAAWSGEVEK